MSVSTEIDRNGSFIYADQHKSLYMLLHITITVPKKRHTKKETKNVEKNHTKNRSRLQKNPS